MGAVTLEQIRVTSLKRIPVLGGDVLHALKRTDDGFLDFGEAYFSMVEFGAVKAWKLHRRMTLNLVVPVGEVRFVFFAEDGKTRREDTIGISNYARLTVPPGIWFGFQGLEAPFSLILNVADIPHEPDEVERKPLEGFDYRWERMQ
jgi:dTDP-4-dehydrorhamnose 3,5-epimerase